MDLDNIVEKWIESGKDQDALFEILGSRYPGADLNAAILRAVRK